jgi:hypothetical protein
MKVTRNRPWAEVWERMLLIGLLAWLIVIGGTAIRAATDSALQVSPHSHDFGAVKRLGGEVQTTFMIHNQGNTPIKIRRIWTS